MIDDTTLVELRRLVKSADRQAATHQLEAWATRELEAGRDQYALVQILSKQAGMKEHRAEVLVNRVGKVHYARMQKREQRKNARIHMAFGGFIFLTGVVFTVDAYTQSANTLIGGLAYMSWFLVLFGGIYLLAALIRTF